MRAIFHIHTKYSFDSFLCPKKIIKLAWKNRVDFVFIVDHNTIRGALEAKKYAEVNNIPVNVIVCEEVETNVGDIIGIFLKQDIKIRNYKEVIKEIKRQGGMVVLPHPYISHDIDKILEIDGIDFVEIWNSRLSKTDDEKAEKLRKKLRSKPIVGSDAHLANELFNSFIIFDSIKDFKNGRIIFKVIRKSCSINKIISFVIKKLKKVIR